MLPLLHHCTQIPVFVRMCVHVCTSSVSGGWTRYTCNHGSACNKEREAHMLEKAAHKYNNALFTGHVKDTDVYVRLFVSRFLIIDFSCYSHCQTTTTKKCAQRFWNVFLGWPQTWALCSAEDEIPLRIWANSVLSQKYPPSAQGIQLKLHDQLC